MVVICDKPYPAESDYDSHFETFPYPLSDFQKYAIEGIVSGNHVLVTAPTGSGKTLPAEFAIQYFVGKGKRVVYTTPVKALSNQKFYEFTKKFPHISFGLCTGDIKTNPSADVVICTMEIMTNYLFTAMDKSASETSQLQFQIDVQNELSVLIMDEAHYINDKDRGEAWERAILMLPPHVQLLMMSATIDNPVGFAEWCERQGSKQVYWAYTTKRVVPLSHYGFLTTTESIFKCIKDKQVQAYIRENTNTLIPLQTATHEFQEPGFRTIQKIKGLFDTNRAESKRKHVLNQLALFLRDRDMLPALAFVFSRKHVELCAEEITVPLLEDDSKVGYTVRRECESIVRKLPNYQEYLQLPEYNRLVALLERGIGIHHSGMIPILREIVELMISRNVIKLLFATDSFSIGLDCPIRTTIFTNIKKYDKQGERFLHAHEYSQAAGRAGRRGLDTIGYVVHCNNLFDASSITDYKSVMSGIPQTLVSKYHISYGLILNLLKNGQTTGFHRFSEKSMVYNEIQKSIQVEHAELLAVREKISKKRATVLVNRTPEPVCIRYVELETLAKTSVNKKRKDAEKEMQSIRDEYRSLSQDLATVKEYLDLEVAEKKCETTVSYMESYIRNQTELVCDLLTEDGFITKDGGEEGAYALSTLGKIASNIAEVHPLVLSRFMVESNYFEGLSSIQFVGLLSCFTDIKIPEDEKMSRPLISDLQLKRNIEQIVTLYENYERHEVERDIRSGLKYEGAVIFDLVELSMQWCRCSTEAECKYFIQTAVAEKSISIGDFTKAMLKLVTISRELVSVCEEAGRVDVLYKLNEIEGLVLKYVATSQSLYV
jgi:superfamily II RNA helicase